MSRFTGEDTQRAVHRAIALNRCRLLARRRRASRSSADRARLKTSTAPAPKFRWIPENLRHATLSYRRSRPITLEHPRLSMSSTHEQLNRSRSSSYLRRPLRPESSGRFRVVESASSAHRWLVAGLDFPPALATLCTARAVRQRYGQAHSSICRQLFLLGCRRSAI